MIISGTILAVFVYLAGTFIAWDFDPSGWSNGLRGAIALMWFALLILSVPKAGK